MNVTQCNLMAVGVSRCPSGLSCKVITRDEGIYKCTCTEGENTGDPNLPMETISAMLHRVPVLLLWFQWLQKSLNICQWGGSGRSQCWRPHRWEPGRGQQRLIYNGRSAGNSQSLAHRTRRLRQINHLLQLYYSIIPNHWMSLNMLNITSIRGTGGHPTMTNKKTAINLDALLDGSGSYVYMVIATLHNEFSIIHEPIISKLN